MKKLAFYIFLLLFSSSYFSCGNIDSYKQRVFKIKNNTVGKKISFFENGSINQIIDSSDDTLFVGSRFAFTITGNLKQYSFQIDTFNASYIETFNDKGEIIETEGNPIVYSLTSADESKDSIFIKRYISSFSYKDIQVETAGLDKIFRKRPLKVEPKMSFIESFQIFENVKDLKRFVFITKFSGRRIDDNSFNIFYDTVDVTRRD